MLRTSGVGRRVRRTLVAATVAIGSYDRRTARACLALVRRFPRSGVRARLYRNVSWPVACAVDTTLEARTPGGTMRVATSEPFGRVVAVSGVWEPHVTDVVTRLLEPGDVCVDVGAHAGYYTLLASSLVGRGGRVYALEPASASFAALCDNLARNGVENVTALQIAAGERESTAELVEGEHGNSLLTSVRPRAADASGDGETVSVRPVAGILRREDAARLRLVKVDAEGSEGEVLRGLGSLLSGGGRMALVIELAADRAEGGVRDDVLRLRDEGFRIRRIANEYDADSIFPSRPLAPLDVTTIPAGRCDLLLSRG